MKEVKTFVVLSQKEKVERWENVLRVLQSLSPHERRKHFDMSDWGSKTECGTVACAAGHCGMDPWFRRRGFKMDFVYDEYAGWDSIHILYGKSLFFFGREGTDEIFVHPALYFANVGQVIKKVKQYITHLKKHGYGSFEKVERELKF